MTTFENSQYGTGEGAPRITVQELMSKMMIKFSAPEALFIPSDVPHIVLEDLSKLGAALQPVNDGTRGTRISWNSPAMPVAKNRATYGQPSAIHYEEMTDSHVIVALPETVTTSSL